jgi:Na+/H+-dicarboxylate symporter
VPAPETPSTLTLAKLAKTVNRPSIAMAAILLGVGLGILRLPFVAYLQPVGDFYVALLQICVLPFLLATIPLAVRSAMTSGSGGRVVGRLVGWLLVTVIVTTSIALLVATVVFGFMPADPSTISRVGALFGAAADRVDIELTLNPLLAAMQSEPGFLAALPTNIFSALASNDSMTVIVFAAIFGAAMVISERSSGTSIFGALKHIQTVCLLVFDWFNVLAPIGIIALIAPQVARIGPEIYSILAPFVYVFLVTSLLLLALSVASISMGLRLHPRKVFSAMLKPLVLVIATRNALVCVPAGLEALKEDLKAPKQHCDLFIPIGYAVMRFGPMVHFVAATLFIGYLMGRPFSGIDLLMVAGLSLVASFATIGVNGVVALGALAIVLRPFGLSYELALPLLVIVDPVMAMVRGVLNVAANSQIPVLAAWQRTSLPVRAPAA